MARPIIARPDFEIDWQPDAELLARAVQEEPLLGDPINLLLGRPRPADPAVLLMKASDLRPLHSSLDLAGLGYGGPDDLVSLAWVADAAEAVAIARVYLAAGDVSTVTETMVVVGPSKSDAGSWDPIHVGPYLAQARGFVVELDPGRPMPVATDASGFDREFLSLEGVRLDRDPWAGRDLFGDAFARWRGRRAA